MSRNGFWSKMVISGGVLVCITLSARGDIHEWEWISPGNPGPGKYETSIPCPGGGGVDAVPSANLSSRDLTKAYLIGKDLSSANINSSTLTNADLSQANLFGTKFRSATLTNAKLAQTNLTYASFDSATLTGANLAEAVVTWADFRGTTSKGFSAGQLYCTDSYKAKNLQGINLSGNDHSGWNFAGQNLTYAHFYAVILTGANLTGADTRNAFQLTDQLSSAITTNLIRPDGSIYGLNLSGGKKLVVRDYDVPEYGNKSFPIHVNTLMDMGTDGILEVVFNDPDWYSKISYEGESAAKLGGTLAIKLTDGFVPEAGNEFQILNFSSRVGTFGNLTGWNLGNGLFFDPVYTDTSLTLQVLHARNGDASCDKKVDVSDLGVLAANYGRLSGATWAMGDFNGDGRVDVSDLGILAANYGQTGTAVPEPATLALLILGGMTLRRRGGKWKAFAPNRSL